MAFAALKMKIMPSSPQSNLEKIREEAEKKITSLGAKLHSHEEEDIAFGLKALILTIAWPEEKEQEEIEHALSNIEDVQSVNVIDFRRAIG